MCGRYVLDENPDRRLKARWAQSKYEFTPRFNLAPTQAAPVARLAAGAALWSLDMLQWGLVPFWASEPRMRQDLINARSETVATNPAFRAAFKSRRCLVPATAFYEWSGPKGAKQPYLFRRADGEMLLFAGLWETWDKDGRDTPLATFTLLTTTANDDVRELHDRMPVIVSARDGDTWLDADAADQDGAHSLLTPAPKGTLTRTRVSTAVNNARFDGPACVLPLDERGE